MVDIWNWVACGEQRQEEEDGGSFRVVQWNTLADGNLPGESIRAGAES